MSWDTILKRGGSKTVFYPQFRAALEEAINTYETFTLSDIIPIARELYKDKLIDENSMRRNAATTHASAQLNMANAVFITKTINHIGTHKKTKRRDYKNEFIFKRI